MLSHRAHCKSGHPALRQEVIETDKSNEIKQSTIANWKEKIKCLKWHIPYQQLASQPRLKESILQEEMAFSLSPIAH